MNPILSPHIDHLQPQSVACYTLGCKLNFVESSTIVNHLYEAGFTKAQKGETPSICFIHTCSVTEVADKKSRQTIRSIIRKYPTSLVVVAGCYAQLQPEIVAAIPGVDMVVGMNHKFDIPTLLSQLDSKQNGAIICHCPSSEITGFHAAIASGQRTRYMLKVQDGCDYYCSYCTVPIARGPSRNPSIASLVEQAQQAVDQGAREIVLSGVNIGDFGKSTSNTFMELVEALDRVEGAFRYRISSIEPNLLRDEIIEFIAASRHFTPHLHLPLQSGSNDVLKLMARRYNRELFADKVHKIKQLMPHAFIGVDVIVGTRGERADYFEDSYLFLDSLPLSQLHVFAYSERQGTRALDIPNPVSSVDKSARSERLIALSDQKLRDFYTAHLATQGRVLAESTHRSDYMYGFTDNYIKVELPCDPTLFNQFLQVRLDTLEPSQDPIVAGQLIRMV